MAVELDKEEVISLYETGMTKIAVAKELGTTVTTLSKFMKKNDIKTRDDKKSPKAGYQSIREEKIFFEDINIGYKPTKTEKPPAQKKENALNMFIPEKWNWRD